jgi:hypothetical protein
MEITTPLQTGPKPALEEPGNTSMIRCPLPPIFSSNPDSLRQFDAKGQIPQNRILSPALDGDNSTFSGTINEFVSSGVVSGGGGSSSGGGGSTVPVTAAQQSITTSILNPGQVFTGTVPLSRSFQMLTITSNMAVRVQGYGTRIAQTLDLSRAIDVGPAPGTTQNLIFDIVLDTTPFQWSFQNVVGANGDTPQMGQMYVTVTNVGQASAQATVTFLYVPLES